MLFENCCLEEVFLVMCAFLKKKVHSLSVAPEPLAIWNKKLEGLESELFKELKTSSDDMQDLVDILMGVSK